jgi:virulence factor
MKVGVVGLGDIATKAYLPVIMSRADLTPHLFTRNAAVLNAVGDAYRVPKNRRFDSLGKLLAAPLDAVFVHAATSAHLEVVRPILARGIPVYVDKPLDNFYRNSRALVQTARQEQKLLMVGFNRRRAPLYRLVKEEVPDPAILLMQKNRASSPQEARHVVYDDFIHVVDTLRFLMGESVDQVAASGRWQGSRLSALTVHLTGKRTSAVGVMNRMNGANEEILEAMGAGVKWRVLEMRDGWRSGEDARHVQMDGWAAVADVKGFSAIIDEFLRLVRQRDVREALAQADDALLTHRVCETVIEQLEQQRTTD